MLLFYYEIDDLSGTGSADAYIEAASEDAARTELCARGVNVTHIEEVVE